jgi:hypothetical protein
MTYEQQLAAAIESLELQLTDDERAHGKTSQPYAETLVRLNWLRELELQHHQLTWANCA